MKSDDARFRITTWPPDPVTPLPVRRFTADLVDDGSIEWFPAAGESLFDLPPELILRELQDLDLDSSEDVIQFVRDYGPIQRSFKLFGLQPAYGFDKPLARSYIWNHIVDVAMYLRTMRAMVNHWLADLEGDDPADAWLVESSPSLEPRYPAHPWERFAETMSEGLDVYRVRVEYTIPLESGPITRHAPDPDLFSAMCLQLFNLMSEDLPVRRCANETCGRRFFRQMGRAEYGQYRSEGVRFCSKSCAKSQVQREYRRRKKETS